MAYNIYPSTNSVRVDIKILDPNDENTTIIDWSSVKCPQYVVSMQHTLNANGSANDLSLTLYHHIDPYSEEGYGPEFTKDAFGDSNDDPSYLMLLISRGYGTIYFRYGYVQDIETLNSGSFSGNSSASTTNWFKMYITEVSSSFDTNGITYNINAISTLVNAQVLLTGNAYNWYYDPENRLGLGVIQEYSSSSSNSYSTEEESISVNSLSPSSTNRRVISNSISGNLIGGVGSDFIKVDFGSDEFSKQLNQIVNEIDFSALNNNSMQGDLKQRIINLAKYIAEKSNYKTDLTDFISGGDLQLKNSFNANMFYQTADMDLISFINGILDNIKLVSYVTNNPINYTELDGTTRKISSYYTYKDGWVITLSDEAENNSSPTMKLTWTNESITEKNLLDLATMTPEQIQANASKYRILLTRLNGEDKACNLGALVYNFSTFDRDMSEPLRISYRNLFANNSNFPVKLYANQNVQSDIIELNLNYPILAGIAGAYQGGGLDTYNVNNISTGGAATDENGNAVTVSTYSGAYTSSGVINSNNILSQLMKQKDNFKQIMNRLFVEGTVVIPGVAKVITLLSRINIFVYISNKLDLTSGKYLVISQIDKITDGVYVTELVINKVETFDSQTVYQTGSSSGSSTDTSIIAGTTNFDNVEQVSASNKVRGYDPNSEIYDAFQLPAEAQNPVMIQMMSYIKAASIFGIRYSRTDRDPYSQPPKALDCSSFVSHVIKFSGIDPNFKQQTTLGLFNNSEDQLVEIDKSNVRAGDILVYSYYTYEPNDRNVNVKVRKGHTAIHITKDFMVHTAGSDGVCICKNYMIRKTDHKVKVMRPKTIAN